jgi:hypothetical protein
MHNTCFNDNRRSLIPDFNTPQKKVVITAKPTAPSRRFACGKCRLIANEKSSIYFFYPGCRSIPGCGLFKKHTNKTIINTIEKQSTMHKSMTVKRKKQVARRSVQ